MRGVEVECISVAEAIRFLASSTAATAAHHGGEVTDTTNISALKCCRTASLTLISLA